MTAAIFENHSIYLLNITHDSFYDVMPLKAGFGTQRYIANLGHGMHPSHDPEHLGTVRVFTTKGSLEYAMIESHACLLEALVHVPDSMLLERPPLRLIVAPVRAKSHPNAVGMFVDQVHAVSEKHNAAK
jgi:hypothetical protein